MDKITCEKKKIRQIYIFSTSQKTKAPHLNNLLIILTDLKIKVQYRIKIYVLAYTCRNFWITQGKVPTRQRKFEIHN